MSIEKLDHIYAETRRFEKTVAFWQDLGFTVASEWGDEGHRACRLVCGDAAVVLAEADPLGSPQSPTVHFAMKDPEALAETLAAAENVEVVTPLEDTHWGTRWIRVQDPDGNLYCLEDPGRGE
jgi:catechol 2,3-dioxygenase-like lactoylglutathione lyase family enzyme